MFRTMGAPLKLQKYDNYSPFTPEKVKIKQKVLSIHAMFVKTSVIDDL